MAGDRMMNSWLCSRIQDQSRGKLLTGEGVPGQCTMNEQVRGDEKKKNRVNIELWDFKRWPWRPVKSNSRLQRAFTRAAQSKSNTDFYGLVFQQPQITYITAKLKAK